jgi:hypothetical protein
VRSLTQLELLVFSRAYELPELSSWCRENQLDGQCLEFVTDSELCQLNLSLKQRLKFFTGVVLLEQGVLEKEAHSHDCLVCKHQTEESQMNFWREWKLQFPEQFDITPKKGNVVI